MVNQRSTLNWQIINLLCKFCLKMGHSRPLFLYFRLFYKQLTVNKCSIKVANDWIQTRVLWYRKQPLCQLRHNHCPALQILFMVFGYGLISSHFMSLNSQSLCEIVLAVPLKVSNVVLEKVCLLLSSLSLSLSLSLASLSYPLSPSVYLLLSVLISLFLTPYLPSLYLYLYYFVTLLCCLPTSVSLFFSLSFSSHFAFT